MSCETETRSTTRPEARSKPFAWRRWSLVAVVLAVAGAVGHWCGRAFIVSGFENGNLDIEPDRLQLGDVWEQSELQWTLPIRNTTSRDIEIERFVTSCGCGRLASESLVVPAGATADARLTLDLTNRVYPDAPQASWPFTVQLAPVIRGGLAQYRGWRLEGTVHRPYRLSVSPLTFGDSLVAGERFEPRAAELTANVSLAELTAQSERPDLLRVDLERSGKARAYHLRATPEPTTRVGTYQFRVLLKGVTEAGERLPPVPLPVAMDIVDDVEIVPAGIVFGSLPLGRSAEETVILRSRTAKTFEAVPVPPGHESGLSVERVAVSGSSMSFRVCQRCVALANQAQEVRFAIEDRATKKRREVRLPACYFGVEPDAAATPRQSGG